VHGDLHFDNTIYCADTGKFTLIDWRTDFANKTYGDIYYDLAKILGGIWLNYRAVKQNKLGYQEFNGCATLSIPSVENPQLYEDILHDWVKANNLDWKKIKILVPLIYLNMSPLHESPFDKFLISLAQLNFSKIFS
jgi:thiamine kinase-like enzyme